MTIGGAGRGADDRAGGGDRDGDGDRGSDAGAGGGENGKQLAKGGRRWPPGEDQGWDF